MYQQLKMVEKEIQFLLDQIEMFDLFPLMRPKDYVDPKTGEPDKTWIYPCKVDIFKWKCCIKIVKLNVI